MHRVLLGLAGFNGMLAVIFGAFGAHAIKPQLTEKLWSAYGTASSYHFYHVLALLALAAISWHQPEKIIMRIGLGFQLGIVLFCGSLYALALGAPSIIGPITPIGGLIFIISWGGLLWAALRPQTRLNK